MWFKTLWSFQSLNFCFQIDDYRFIMDNMNHSSAGFMMTWDYLSFWDVFDILIEIEKVLIELLSWRVNKFFSRTHLLLNLSLVRCSFGWILGINCFTIISILLSFSSFLFQSNFPFSWSRLCVVIINYVIIIQTVISLLSLSTSFYRKRMVFIF